MYIEVNGLQHYKNGNGRYNITREEFEYQKYKDKIKRNFANERGIFLEIDLRKYPQPEDAIKFIENKIKKIEKEK